VLHADGTAAASIRVQLVRRRLRSASQLGDARTNASGHYTIRYTAPKDGGAVDLVLRALDERDAVLAESPVLFAAPQDATINLALGGDYRGASESELMVLLARLERELDGVSIANLHQDATQKI
jgi:hypothetical protein